MVAGFFDVDTRLSDLKESRDTLEKLKNLIPWEEFRLQLEVVHEKERKSNAGRKPFDVILMLKILILQSLYNLSDDEMEYQIKDRLSFMNFLDLSFASPVPDAKTIWLFRDRLEKHDLVKRIFLSFDKYLREHGFEAKSGQIVDATIVRMPIQRNTKDENDQIKKGNPPEDWSDNKRRQKDVDARWTRKDNKLSYGVKNHAQVDVDGKFVRDYDVTPASTHDSQVLDEILDPDNSSKDVYADSAYRSKKNIKKLEKQGYTPRFQKKSCKHYKLTEEERQDNRTNARTRCRIEHVFGAQFQRAGNLILRTIGIVRAKVKIGLRNLAYNMSRFCFLITKTA